MMALALTLGGVSAKPPNAPGCVATASSLTPAAWMAPRGAERAARGGALRVLSDVPLPGPANRFDYQSFDPTTRRIYINHMNAGRTLVFDVDKAKVIKEIGDVPRATGVLAVPARHQVYVSAAGAHEVAIIDDRTLTISSRVGGIQFPDGIAYDPENEKVFVSDESGSADVVIDAATGIKRSTIALGGEAGNTHYDSVSHCILVAVQTRNQLVAIDPDAERIVARYDLPGAAGPHGFALDEPDRLAFVASEENATLQVVDLRTMRVVAQYAVGDSPDVLAWDPGWQRLYVASEGGVLSEFQLEAHSLKLVGELRIPHAHTVSVDPTTHRVYLPLENVNGKPVLRILAVCTRHRAITATIGCRN